MLFARKHRRIPDRYQRLETHLAGVAQRARVKLSVIGPLFGLLAELCGAVHDLGKSTDRWQRYLINGGGRVNHTAAGALWHERARRLILPNQVVDFLLKSVIAGHHGGLRNFNVADDIISDRRPLREFLENGLEDCRGVNDNIVTLPLFVEQLEKLKLPFLSTDEQQQNQGLAIETFTRFLFSALVSADAEDATLFERGSAIEWVDAVFPSMSTLVKQYEAGLNDIIKNSNPRLKVNRLRQQVSRACLSNAKRSPGFYTLTAPTGLGKTFAGMRFALHHAAQHGLRRIIYTAPFTNIIEQNTDQYRKLFDNERVITEHHSNIDPEKDSRFNRRMSLFWSAPIICTSNLQLVESLFSNRVGRCRKLHNIVRSCIVFDEAQELPPHLLTPTLDMLKRLVENYGCSVVFTTATQPALQSRLFENGLDNVTELVPDPVGMMQEARRIVVEWPEGPDDRWSWDALATRLKRHPQVICSVYKRADAVEVFNRLPKRGRYHLSALMCPQHRSDTLDEIKQQLKAGQIVRLVCTRLIKAGVNIDFPKGYEAAQGPDDVLQFGGRVNRDGKRRRYRSVVRVYYTTDSAPVSGQPRRSHGLLRRMLNQQAEETGRYELDLFDPATYEQYFSRLYANTDTNYEDVQQDRRNQDFVTVDRKMRFIRDNFMTTVLVPYRDGVNIIEQLKEKGTEDYRLLRKMQRYSVAIYRQDRNALEGLLLPVHPDLPDIFYLDLDAADTFYSNDVGLCTPERLNLLLGIDDLSWPQ